MHHIFFIHLSADGHLGCFHVRLLLHLRPLTQSNIFCSYTTLVFMIWARILFFFFSSLSPLPPNSPEFFYFIFCIYFLSNLWIFYIHYPSPIRSWSIYMRLPVYEHPLIFSALSTSVSLQISLPCWAVSSVPQWTVLSPPHTPAVHGHPHRDQLGVRIR